MKISMLLPAMLMAALSANAAPRPSLKFHTIRMPGKSVGTNAIDDAGDMVGGSWTGALKPNTRENCFLFSTATGKLTPFTNPSARGATECWDIDNFGNIAGDYVSKSGARVGFLYNNGTFTDVKFPNAVETVAEGVTVGPQVVGYYIDTAGARHGFYVLLGNGPYMQEDVQGDTQTGLFGISDSGFYTAQSQDKADNTVSDVIFPPMEIRFPGSVTSYTYQLNDNLFIAATWVDTKSVSHGGIFNFAENSPETIDVAGATFTEARGINNKKQIVGRYQTKDGGRSLGFYTTGTP